MEYWPKIFRVIFFLGLGSWVFLLWQKNPYQNIESGTLNWPMVFAFDGTFFLWLWALFFIFLFWLKTHNLTRRGKNSQISVIFRQSFFLGLTGLVLLILQQLKALFWWDGLLVVAAILLFEMYFLSFGEKDGQSFI